jgi:hypothetical protein
VSDSSGKLNINFTLHKLISLGTCWSRDFTHFWFQLQTGTDLVNIFIMIPSFYNTMSKVNVDSKKKLNKFTSGRMIDQY